MMTFAAHPTVLQAPAESLTRRHFFGAVAGAGMIPASLAPVHGPEHLDEHEEWFVRVTIFPAGCTRPINVEVEELTAPGWAMTIERTRLNPDFIRYAEAEGLTPDPDDLDPPVYRLPSNRP